jgi:hypothetical protein
VKALIVNDFLEVQLDELWAKVSTGYWKIRQTSLRSFDLGLLSELVERHHPLGKPK